MYFKQFNSIFAGSGNPQGKVIFAGYDLVAGSVDKTAGDGTRPSIVDLLIANLWANIKYDQNFITRQETAPVTYRFRNDMTIGIDFNFWLSSSVGNRTLQIGTTPNSLSGINIYRSVNTLVTPVNTSTQMISNNLTNAYSYPAFQQHTLAMTCDTSTAGLWRFRDRPTGFEGKCWLIIRLMEKWTNML